MPGIRPEERDGDHEEQQSGLQVPVPESTMWYPAKARPGLSTLKTELRQLTPHCMHAWEVLRFGHTECHVLAGNKQEASGGLPQLNATGRNTTMSHKRDVAGLFSTDTLPTMQYELPSSKTIKQVHR